MGLAEIVKAAGGDAAAAVQLMYVQQLPELMKIQTEALKQVKFGDITLVGGTQEGQSGVSSLLKELSVGMAGAAAIGQQLGVPFLQGNSKTQVSRKETTEEQQESADGRKANDLREFVEVGD